MKKSGAGPAPVHPPLQSAPNSPSHTTISKAGRRRLGSVGKGGQSKMRAKLPPIEAYEKELVFQAEGPGRVIVRLERLMGSDRVRLTDTKYMSTLLERLEADERRAWTKRRLARIRAERQRFRKLAIDGLTEPGPDMQDLTSHPVFRVNRILNKMSQIDSQLTPAPPQKLPPITEINPFEFDETGRIFCSYPSHIELHNELHREEERRNSRSQAQSYRGSLRSSVMNNEREGSVRTGSQFNRSSIRSSSRLSRLSANRSQTSSIRLEKQPAAVSTSSKFHTLRLSEARPKDMEEMLKDYGVITEKDLLREYEPHQASLVHAVFEEDGQDLYRTADAVLQVYKYEQEAVDTFIRKNRHVPMS